MKRRYETLIQEHFRDLNQMVFLAGPMQGGKTTISFLLGEKVETFFYFNWDDFDIASRCPQIDIFCWYSRFASNPNQSFSAHDKNRYQKETIAGRMG